MSESRLYAEYRDTPLWRALSAVLSDLQASNELSVATAPDYVIGYLCQELAAKSVITEGGLTPDR